MRLAWPSGPQKRTGTLPALALAPVLAAMVTALGGCAGDGARDALKDTHWRFTVIDGRKPYAADAGLSFGNRHLDVALGCNAMAGPWKFTENRLLAGPMTTTEMACQNESWPQEQAVGALLAASPRLLIDGDRMTIQSAGHTAELERVSRK